MQEQCKFYYLILAINPTVGGCGGQVEGTKGYGYPVLCGYSKGTCGEETEQSRDGRTINVWIYEAHALIILSFFKTIFYVFKNEIFAHIFDKF